MVPVCFTLRTQYAIAKSALRRTLELTKSVSATEKGGGDWIINKSKSSEG